MYWSVGFILQDNIPARNYQCAVLAARGRSGCLHEVLAQMKLTGQMMVVWVLMMSYDWNVVDDVTAKYSCNPAKYKDLIS
jgi:hypothetical protein